MNKHHGFTLIEMIIAITLLGITMSLAYAALHVANRTVSSVHKVQNEVEALRTTYFILSRHLSQAVYNTQDDSGFIGSQNSLGFQAYVPMRAFGGGRLYRFHVFQEPNENGNNQLSLTYEPVSGSEEPTKLRLAEFHGTLEFSYLATSSRQSADDWSSGWQQNGLPALVKVQLVDDISSYWPEQVITMRYSGI